MPGERQIIESKRGVTRLGFTLLFKFFQLEGRFPSGSQEIPSDAVQFVAQQVGVDPGTWKDYPWQGRSVEYHRASIRRYLGFREATVADTEALKAWLIDDILNPMSTGWNGFEIPFWTVAAHFISSLPPKNRPVDCSVLPCRSMRPAFAITSSRALIPLRWSVMPSGLPWSNLSNLDAMRDRSKPPLCQLSCIAEVRISPTTWWTF